MSATAADLTSGSVTLYGVIDQGVDFTSNAQGSRAYAVQGGDLQGERWGLKGREPLGNGLEAQFALESGFQSSSGRLNQGGRMFGRQAYAGLSSNQWGSLTVGRQYDTFVDLVAPMTANGSWGGGPFGHPFDNDNSSNSFRVSNAVKYTSRPLDGWSVSGLYGMSNSTGFADNRTWSAGAQYARGPLTVAAAFLRADHPGATAAGALATNEAMFLAGQQTIWGAGVQYQWGANLFGVVYSHTDVRSPSAISGAGTFAGSPSDLRFDNAEINALHRFSPFWSAGVMYTYTQARYAAGGGARAQHAPKWHQAGLFVDYQLSKRTDVYAAVGYTHAVHANTGTFLDRPIISGAAGAADGNSQALARLGVRHLF